MNLLGSAATNKRLNKTQTCLSGGSDAHHAVHLKTACGPRMGMLELHLQAAQYSSSPSAPQLPLGLAMIVMRPRNHLSLFLLHT